MNNVNELLYKDYSDNECYFFSYDHLNIDFLSKLFNRERESIVYQNGKLYGYKRIFCKNEDKIIASIHENYNSYVYGIIVKISCDELEILKSYYKNYTLYNSLVGCTSSKIVYEKNIKFDKITYTATDHPSITPYIFIHNNYLNDDQNVPTQSYISEIRKMLNDRHLIEDCKILPIIFNCVKHRRIEKKYKDDYNEELYKILNQNNTYSKNDIHIVTIGYEEIDY